MRFWSPTFVSSALIALLTACASAPQPETHAISVTSALAKIPSAEDSDEATKPLLRLAREQGEAYQKALDYMLHQQAVDGREVRAGDYIVGYAVEQAEGFYEAHGEKLKYRRVDRSGEVNVHVEIVVRDGRDGRFVPNLKVKATIVDEAGKEIGTKDEPFMWHPWLYHYGENWRVPVHGPLTLKVAIEAPEFRRHDSVNGARYLQPVIVEFKDVHAKRGQK